MSPTEPPSQHVQVGNEKGRSLTPSALSLKLKSKASQDSEYWNKGSEICGFRHGLYEAVSIRVPTYSGTVDGSPVRPTDLYITHLLW